MRESDGQSSGAALIDNRENVGSDTDEAVAITASGETVEVTGEEWACLRDAHLARHPCLDAFATSPLIAILRIRVRSQLVVRHFQDVAGWRVED